MNPLILLGAGGTLIWLLSRGAKKGKVAELLSYSVASLNVQKIDLSSIKMRVVFDVLNPTDEQLTFKSFVGGIFLDGKKLSNLSTMQDVVLMPGTTKLPIDFSISNMALGTQALEILQGNIPSSYTIKGILKVAGLVDIPIDQEIALSQDSAIKTLAPQAESILDEKKKEILTADVPEIAPIELNEIPSELPANIANEVKQGIENNVIFLNENNRELSDSFGNIFKYIGRNTNTPFGQWYTVNGKSGFWNDKLFLYNDHFYAITGRIVAVFIENGNYKIIRELTEDINSGIPAPPPPPPAPISPSILIRNSVFNKLTPVSSGLRSYTNKFNAFKKQ